MRPESWWERRLIAKRELFELSLGACEARVLGALRMVLERSLLLGGHTEPLPAHRLPGCIHGGVPGGSVQVVQWSGVCGGREPEGYVRVKRLLARGDCEPEHRLWPVAVERHLGGTCV